MNRLISARATRPALLVSPTAPVVYVIDDDPAVRVAVTRLLKSEGYAVAAFDSAAAFMQRYDPGAPGCILLDVAMPGLDGLTLQGGLARSGSGTPIIFVTGHADVPMSVQAMKCGAFDFLTKPFDDSVLLNAVGRALVRDEALRKARHERDLVAVRMGTLTMRERQVLAHVVAGRLNKQIAGDLGTVEKTIKVHRGRMMEKMSVRSVAELVRLLERGGFETGDYGRTTIEPVTDAGPATSP